MAGEAFFYARLCALIRRLARLCALRRRSATDSPDELRDYDYRTKERKTGDRDWTGKDAFHSVPDHAGLLAFELLEVGPCGKRPYRSFF